MQEMFVASQRGRERASIDIVRTRALCVCVLPAIIAGSIKADRIMSPQPKHICFTGLLLPEPLCSGH